jgi:hypothetical protein
VRISPDLRRGTARLCALAVAGATVALFTASCFVDLEPLRNRQCSEGLIACGDRCLVDCNDGGSLVDGSSGEGPPTDVNGPDGDVADAKTDSARPNPCPSSDAGLRGPPLVPIVSGANRYCIDATEVTIAQYNELVAVGGASATMPGYCPSPLAYERTNTSCLDKPDLPANVNWCQAYMYCKWAGKRLCGALGAGTETFPPKPDVVDEWMLACVDGNANASSSQYPYGKIYEPRACNVSGERPSPRACPGSGISVTNDYRIPAGSLERCVTPSGVHDLVGNSWEWVDGCGTDANANPVCTVRGGSFATATDPSAYTCASSGTKLMVGADIDVSFRCCFDLK